MKHNIAFTMQEDHLFCTVEYILLLSSYLFSTYSSISHPLQYTFSIPLKIIWKEIVHWYFTIRFSISSSTVNNIVWIIFLDSASMEFYHKKFMCLRIILYTLIQIAFFHPLNSTALNNFPMTFKTLMNVILMYLIYWNRICIVLIWNNYFTLSSKLKIPNPTHCYKSYIVVLEVNGSNHHRQEFELALF